MNLLLVLFLRSLPPRRRARAAAPELRRACLVAFGSGLLLATWLTLRHTGDLPPAHWLPEHFVRWVNEHGRSRNVPAYFLLALPAFLAFRLEQQLAVTIVLGGVAAGLEFLQLAVASRCFDPWDIVLSWVGVLLAGACVQSLRRLTGNFTPRCHEFRCE